MPPKKTTTPMTDVALKQLIAQGVANALAEHEANRNSRNGDDNHDSRSGGRRRVPTTRECTYSDFLKCQPPNFKGTKGVIGMTQWFEKMESVLHISNYIVVCQIKFATCTLLGSTLTWWNSHVKTVSHDVAYEIPWKTLKKMMTTKYCPRREIKKLEIEIWNLKVKESDELKKYVGGLPDMIQEKKIKLDDKSRNNHTQQQPHKRKNVAKAYTVGPGEKKEYDGSLPLSPATTANHQRAPGAIQRVVTCFECRVLGNYMKDCRKLKNKNHGNQAGNGEARARAFAIGNAGINPDSNVITSTFLLNNRYASILFNTGADRSFVSTAFSSLIDIIPYTLDHDYDVELANEKIIRVNTLIRGFTLNFLNHPFNIDVMPVELGSFDVIIGMDWLSKYHAVIVCDEKIVRTPFGNEIIIVCGGRSNNGHEYRLNIISCTKTQKYLLKGCLVFFAHITANKVEDKSKENRLEDVPIV
ncbi:putative reverse transcriptase domain-containing protein [Tanacetum coccineum]